ncbi:MAG: PKD domain-containing protein [Patescibacteria group bacterium]
MENQNVPFLNDQTPQAPQTPPASKKKLFLMVAGLLAVSVITYVLGGSDLFKGQLLLSEKSEKEMSKLAEYIKPVSLGDDNWAILTGQEETFEVLESAPANVLFWSTASAGDWKVVHADFTTLLDQTTARKIIVTSTSKFKNTKFASICVNFADGSDEVCNNEFDKKTFEHIYTRPGEFPITMTAIDENGLIDTQIRAVTFSTTDDEKGMFADFSVSIDADDYRTITLQDLSILAEGKTIKNRCIKFGDDTPIVCENTLENRIFTHTYTGDDAYDVSLSIMDQNEESSRMFKRIEITSEVTFKPDFALNKSSDNLNRVWIRDTSVTDKATIVKRCVNFGDGTEDICAPNFNLDMDVPTDYEHTYAQPGNYAIILTLTDNAGRSVTKRQRASPYAVAANFTVTADSVNTKRVTVLDTSALDNIDIGKICVNFGEIGSITGPASKCSTEAGASYEYTYENAGDYTIGLSIYDKTEALATGLLGEKTQSITVVNPDPTAVIVNPEFIFTADAENSKKLTFTSNTTLDNTDLKTECMNFGDGSNHLCDYDDTKTFEHTYLKPGTYEVTLTVSHTSGEPKTLTQTITIKPAPTDPVVFVDFEVTPDPAHPYEPRWALVKNTSTAQNVTLSKSFTVDFGDGFIHQGPENPSHQYAKAGTYDITLTAQGADENGMAVQGSLKKTGNVTDTVPEITGVTPDFSYSVVNPASPKLIKIVDQSTIQNPDIEPYITNLKITSHDDPDTIIYTTNNGTLKGTDYNYEFSEFGTYDITIWLKMKSGGTEIESNKVTKSVTITDEVPVQEIPGLIPDFSYKVNDLDPKYIEISDETTGPNLNAYTLVSNLKITKHDDPNNVLYTKSIGTRSIGGYAWWYKFSQAGEYDITLWIEGSTAKITKTITISDATILADFEIFTPSWAENETGYICINNNSTAQRTEIVSLDIDFGDGYKAEKVSPMNDIADHCHSYSNSGTYQVTLTAYGQLEDQTPNSLTKSVNITVPPAAPEEPSDLGTNVLALLFADTLSLGEKDEEINYIIAEPGATVYFAAKCEAGTDLVHVTPITTDDVEATIASSEVSKTASFDIEKGTSGCGTSDIKDENDSVTSQNAANPDLNTAIDEDEDVDVEDDQDEFAYQDDDDDYSDDDFDDSADDDSSDDDVEADEFEETECSDYVDNDDDGLIDIEEDPGCESLDDDDESNAVMRTETECSDGEDNDGDGFKDTKDPGCQNAKDDDETNEEEVVQEGEVDLPACFASADGMDGFDDISELESTYVIDTEANSSYRGKVADFHGEAIFRGYEDKNGNKTFRPYAPIRRDEAIKTVLLTTCYLDHLYYNDDLSAESAGFEDSEFKSSTYWAKELINIAANAELIEKEEKFYPGQQVTRSEYLKLLLTAYSEITGTDIEECKEGDSPFVDVDASDWYCKYGVLAKELGISEGYTDAKGKLRLNPKKVLTRSDAAIMLWNYYLAVDGSGRATEEGENDVDTTSSGRVLR